MVTPDPKCAFPKAVVLIMGIAGIALSLAVAACRKTDTAPLADDRRLVRSCDSLTSAFMTTLKGELIAAMEEGGTGYAVEVCRVTAPEIAAQFSRAPGWSIKRVSDRSRNPANAPDAYEASVLAILAAPDGPRAFYEWQRPGRSESVFVYFKPIRTAEICLTCHGSRNKMDSTLLATLAQEYPGDRATGYATGDLRGAFVVRVDPSAIRKDSGDQAEESTP